MGDLISREGAIRAVEKIGHLASRVGPTIVSILQGLPSLQWREENKNRKCFNCEHRKVCWLRLKMNEVAVEAQNMGIASNAWVYFEDVAQNCVNYLTDVQLSRGK
jgi:hypothetical protein